MDNPVPMNVLLTIAQVSAETGIAKEVLRKWETRYGFPLPVRDDNGNRVYSAEQLERLRLIRRLLNEGYRPARVVGLQETELSELLGARPTWEVLPAESEKINEVLEWMKSRDPALIREKLRGELAARGLHAFVVEIMPVMNQRVGDAWEKGEIAIRDEHLYSEIVQGLVREALATTIHPQGSPRILLTTPPGEAHGLGILMLEAVMSLDGACCISLGPQSPLDEIVSAAADFQADIVALSFSLAYPRKQIPPVLKELRSRLPAAVKLWAGGAGTLGMERVPRGTTLLASLADAGEMLTNWRKA